MIEASDVFHFVHDAIDLQVPWMHYEPIANVGAASRTHCERYGPIDSAQWQWQCRMSANKPLKRSSIPVTR